METSLGINDYPESYEPEIKKVKGMLYLTYKFEVEVPVEWDKERIEEDMKEYIEEYQQDLIETEMDIRS